MRGAGMNVWLIGAGHVGLVAGLGYAQLGHQVTCVEIDPSRVCALQAGNVPFHEPGLAQLLTDALSVGSIRFTSVLDSRIDADVAVIAVGTPPQVDGAPSLAAVFAAADLLADVLGQGVVLAIKSTVPAGTCGQLRQLLDDKGRADVHLASLPEFLREGDALHDLFHPSRIVIGIEDSHSAAVLRRLHAGIDAPVFVTDLATAEMIKYAANAFLATKISFINEIAAICEHTGADVAQVASGIGLDPRIGPSFLRAGLGYGGSCFPKDTRALVQTAGVSGVDPQLLRAVIQVNQRQRYEPVRRLAQWFGTLDGRIVTLLGVSFKPGTDDIRESPALHLYRQLTALGATVRLCDPIVHSPLAVPPDAAAASVPESVPISRDPPSALTNADAAVLVTEWPQFVHLDWPTCARLMRHAVLFDGRNALNPATMRAAGWAYGCVGQRMRASALESSRW